MAGFRTHITVSTVLGAGYGGAAYVMYGLPWETCLLAGGLCSVSGMLPDIDSDSGRPLHESLAFAAAVVPMMLLHYFQKWGLTHEQIVLAGAAAYLSIRFGLGMVLKHWTVHRGIFHSLPMAAVFGEIGFLLASGDDVLRLYKAGGVVIGFLSHLLLDEIYSVEWGHGLRLKSSFGTALKFWSESRLANLFAYTVLIALTVGVLYQPTSPAPQRLGSALNGQPTATRLIDRILHR
jgi:hypothetical protein